VRKKPLNLLVLECDATKIASQGLSFGHEIKEVLTLFPKSISLEIGLVNSQEDFLKALIHCSENYSSVQHIVIVGHSNRDFCAWLLAISYLGIFSESGLKSSSRKRWR
jgi:hypothetical protein